MFAPTLFTNFSKVFAILLNMAKLNVTLKVRAGEHMSMPALTENRVNDNEKPAFKDHCLLAGHVYSFDDFHVFNYELHNFKCLIKESLLVTKDKPLSRKQFKTLKLVEILT